MTHESDVFSEFGRRETVGVLYCSRHSPRSRTPAAEPSGGEAHTAGRHRQAQRGAGPHAAHGTGVL